MYRDLKPENIGFDAQGTVKIFDFGLSRHLPSSHYNSQVRKRRGNQATFDMSGQVGTYRYMAPEIHRCEPYNTKADVYSFSLVLYELLSLEAPYVEYTSRMHSTLVVHEGERPRICEDWPCSIQRLLEEGWSDDLLERPTIKEARMSLQSIISRNYRETDSRSWNRIRRRSSAEFHSAKTTVAKRDSLTSVATMHTLTSEQTILRIGFEHVPTKV